MFPFMLVFLCSNLGWEPKQGENHLDAMLRGEILTALAMFGHDLTLNEASRRFDSFLNDRSTPLLPPDIRKVGKSTGQSLVLLPLQSPLTFTGTLVAGSICGCYAKSQHL